MFPNFIKDLFYRRSRLVATLRGHSGPVISVTISPNGKLLASGGADGVKVWDMKTHREIEAPQQSHFERGQVSSVCWVTRKNETFDTFCYGNVLGFLVFLQHRPTEARFEVIHSCRIARGGEIVSITADTSVSGATRIATGTRDKCVQVWSFDSSSRKLTPLYSRAYGEERDILPKALAFDNNLDRDLYVFGLYDGGLYKYGGTDAKSISKHQLGSQIGNAAVDVERRICVVDNVGNGFDIYKMDSGHFIRTFATREAKKTHPKGVAFGDNSHLVIGGSDHGKVYIFERKTGKVLRSLTHAKKGGVETIAVHDNDDGSVSIASASSTVSGASPILIWQWTTSGKLKKQAKEDEEWTVMWVIELIGKIVMILATAAYLVDFVKGHMPQEALVEDTDGSLAPAYFFARGFRFTTPDKTAVRGKWETK